MTDPTPSLLDPQLVSRMASMELRARAVAEGAFAGRHHSRRRGRALEFSGHRPYTPSDDWRRIDWRAFARLDRFVVREEHEEANRRVFLLLDNSASMGFAGPGRVPKSRCAAMLLAAMAYGFLRQGEAVGGALFSDRLVRDVPLRGGQAQLPLLMNLLEASSVNAGPTDLARVLDEAGERLGRRAWLILATDFWSGADDKAIAALRRLRARKHEVSVLLPLDPWEEDLALEGDTLFRDMETGETLPAAPSEIRDAYRRLSRERFDGLRRTLSSLRIPAVLCSTGRPLDESLRHFLASAS